MSIKLKILMVSPECVPFAKTGGLGDCVASLSLHLAKLGHDIRVAMPLYNEVELPKSAKANPQPMIINLGYGIEYVRLWEYKNENLITYFLEFDKYFRRDGIYSGCYGDHPDNPERFAFLCRAVLDLCYFKNWLPDLIHCHDWTTGLIPVHLCTTERDRPLGQIGSVFTIHNIQHHGLAPKSILKFSGIPEHVFRPDGVESIGMVNMMKAGIYFSKKLTTVSHCYSKEIQTPNFSFGLDNILKFKAGDLIGICNGMDT
jgi:starch synthase